jgi:hypothetical protein
VTIYIAMTALNFVTPKAAAKHELSFNKLASAATEAGMLTPKSDIVAQQCDQKHFFHISKFGLELSMSL